MNRKHTKCGQSRSEHLKNYNRIKDILEKTEDVDKQIKLAQLQANKITNEDKAINRANAAKDLKQEHLFDVFFRRAYVLGKVSKQDFREYQLKKLGF